MGWSDPLSRELSGFATAFFQPSREPFLIASSRVFFSGLDDGGAGGKLHPFAHETDGGGPGLNGKVANTLRGGGHPPTHPLRTGSGHGGGGALTTRPPPLPPSIQPFGRACGTGDGGRRDSWPPTLAMNHMNDSWSWWDS